ncbi:hypothetical protein [Alicyclobacillus acidiphilus]|uniref:hypothetical protein n=1 Tax=Alicyclobacillus acidiphilus TaxID=182455 RepID=UPI0008301E33|nr:hypothetical protein [Alicyclobacillus acidiphilus]
MFGRRRREEQTLARLDELVRTVQQALERAADHRVHVEVEHLHVDEVSLDELVFRLDRLHIDELSGSLNMGNNFGTDTIKSKRIQMSGTKRGRAAFEEYSEAGANAAESGPSPSVSVGDGSVMRWTDRGYQVKFREK